MSATLRSSTVEFDEVPRDVRVVERPPTWRGVPFSMTYVLLAREPSAGELVAAHEWAYREALPNPRVISPSVLEWSSLFHPRFFDAIAGDGASGLGLMWARGDAAVPPDALVRFRSQSVLFLAGVTLSAAVVQSRYSEGTIASKYDRLWEAGSLADAGLIPELRDVELRNAVSELAADATIGDLDRLLACRRLYMAALGRVAGDDGEVTTITQDPVPPHLGRRFGFVEDLRAAVGRGLRALIVYGSSITSDDFADYDLLVIADDAECVLRRLAGRSPTWHGTELNVGVYTPGELLVMQRLSGDNLGNYGLCLFGEAQVIHKPVGPLLARNLSFGAVRQRQQLGMLSRAVSDDAVGDGEQRRNLYEYFVKIPANVAKGTLGATGRLVAKEDVREWLTATVAFDPLREQRRVVVDPVGALAASSIATGAVMAALNQSLGVVARRPGAQGSEGPG